MAIILVSLQLIAIATGLISAFFWWRSAEKPRVVKTLPDEISDHALAVRVGEDHIIYDIAGQARMSGLGAKWAAVAVFAQALITALVALAGG
jgi:hypothetical protein